MNRFFSSLLILLFSSVTLNAQVESELQIGIGNSNILSDKNLNKNFQSKLDYYLEYGVQYRPSGEFGLQLSTLVHRKGANYTNSQGSSTFLLHYFTLVPAMNYKLNDDFQVYMGPYFSYRFKENYIVQGEKINPGFSDYQSKFSDFGIRSGISFAFDQFFFHLNYSFGITDIRNGIVSDIDAIPVFPNGLYNKNLEIGFGIRLGR